MRVSVAHNHTSAHNAMPHTHTHAHRTRRRRPSRSPPTCRRSTPRPTSPWPSHRSVRTSLARFVFWCPKAGQELTRNATQGGRRTAMTSRPGGLCESLARRTPRRSRRRRRRPRTTQQRRRERPRRQRRRPWSPSGWITRSCSRARSSRTCGTISPNVPVGRPLAHARVARRLHIGAKPKPQAPKLALNFGKIIGKHHPDIKVPQSRLWSVGRQQALSVVFFAGSANRQDGDAGQAVDAGDRHRGRGSDRGVHQKPHHLVIRRQQSETTQLCRRCITARLSLRFGEAKEEVGRKSTLLWQCVGQSECLCAWYSKAWSGRWSMFRTPSDSGKLICCCCTIKPLDASWSGCIEFSVVRRSRNRGEKSVLQRMRQGGTRAEAAESFLIAPYFGEGRDQVCGGAAKYLECGERRGLEARLVRKEGFKNVVGGE